MILPETSERSGTPSKKSMIRRRRHSSAITLEYTQLQKENDREALNAFADSVKNLGAALLGDVVSFVALHGRRRYLQILTFVIFL